MDSQGNGPTEEESNRSGSSSSAVDKTSEQEAPATHTSISNELNMMDSSMDDTSQQTCIDGGAPSALGGPDDGMLMSDQGHEKDHEQTSKQATKELPRGSCLEEDSSGSEPKHSKIGANVVDHDGGGGRDRIAAVAEPQDAPTTVSYTTIGNAPAWNPKWTVVSLKECPNDEDLLEERSGADGTVLVGLLISKGQQKPPSSSHGSKIDSSNTPASKLDQLLYFADFTTPGLCFFVAMTTAAQSEHLLKYSGEKAIFGSLFAIVNPWKAGARDDEVCFIGTGNEIIPLKTPNPLDEISLQTTAESGMPPYFILTNRTVCIYQTAMVDVSGEGYSCEPKIKMIQGEDGRSLPVASRRDGLVLQMNIGFDVGPDEDGGRNHCNVTSVRSWQTSLLFVKPKTLRSFSEENNSALHDAVDGINAIVNANGGWTLFGWVPRGESDDCWGQESNMNTGEGLQSIHVEHFFPTEKRARELIAPLRFDPTAK